MGRKRLPGEPRVTTAIRIPESLHRQLEETAEARDTSINHLLVKAASHYLSHLPPLDPIHLESSVGRSVDS